MKKFLPALLMGLLLAAPAFALDGKDLYESKKCSMCHGPAGKSSNNMFPALAGKDATFLAQETLKIKSGDRTGKMTGSMKMNPGVKNLTEEEAQAIGEYLSKQ
ncbi:MAG: hypothetical protein A2508_00365 [Candidatus Lambdaproteobacteria bacterium RIFOXYD12_FULL_49_8]|uniref:Cytochrome c domain-containing protein n=1 Tax=Candidatus Lambdaproteobacteria bacterium RIFOXYD2_FULL_50_16 TaxID=1817772 RepID=A0A1F6GDY0_9PROT|nr:MAG: hypothetical protein A2527_02355 [Candidatus Lambdaproteobacteria bacterium RIFOXYD2_FULL_50_16]OGG98256.1 MAG: hypothetical protein A2508_00365 [Candidatus Lambdaproteobacteria bacterium RIFOXYD12_FULL_49_8]